jgi:membrane protease YdiL (CAAX protease family)
MNLNLFDILFLSLCAGFGEELLFRAGLQLWVQPLIGSVFFVAIHGYLNPKDWDTSKFGLLVLVFIIGVSYGFEWYGLWFSMVAHASYDFVLFYYWSKQKMITDHFHE